MRACTSLLFLLPVLAVPAAAEEAVFTIRPAGSKSGNGAAVSFAVSAPTDVEVAIVDSRGDVVRHLAAGVLGPNAPEPFRKGSLSQEISWDGKDDAGKTAAGGPFRARVRLGMRAHFDGFIGYDPADYNPLRLGSAADVRALAAAPNGELFVFYMCSARESYSLVLSCAVFDRAGKYLRTILPYSADLPEERLAGLRRVELADRSRAPYVYQHDLKSGSPGRGRALFPLASESAEGISKTQAHRAVATSDGRVAFVNAPFRTSVDIPNVRAVMVIGADGGTDGGRTCRALFDKKIVSATLALSPDEKTIYVTGMSGKKNEATGEVRTCGWDDSETKQFVRFGLNDPRSVAVDGAGNIYVADRGNDRIAVFKPDGAAIGSLKVSRPERVEVHPKTGAVYVLGGDGVGELQKFAGWKAPASLAKASLPTYKHPNEAAIMALDASAEPPILWVAHSTGNAQFAKFALLRIEDRGGAFSKAVDLGKPGDAVVLSAISVMNMSYSRPGGLLNIGGHFYKPEAGGFIDTGDDARRFLGNWDGGFGLDGNFYIQGGRLTLRLGPDLRVLPFPRPDKADNSPDRGGKNDDGMISRYGAVFTSGSARLHGRGVTADRDGNVFVLSEVEPNLQDPTALWKYNPDGSMNAKRLIDTEFRCMESVRLDPQGNIYVAVSIRPGKQLLPPELVGKVPADFSTAEAKKGLECYPDLYGSIVKFGPEGGVIRKGCGGEPANFGHGGQTEVKGAQWMRLGVTGTLGFDAGPEPTHHCSCQSSRFDVDSYGRVFYPDAGRFRVGILDTAGNEIGHFGSYGNVDDGAESRAADSGMRNGTVEGHQPAGAIPRSAGRRPHSYIPFAWPQAVAVDDAGTVYVGDRFNRRVVRVRLGCLAEETCVLP